MGKQAKKFGKEFKEFLVKGNAIMLAVGVVIGGAFQAIVNSLVNDILMPVIGLITGGVDFSHGFVDLSHLRGEELGSIVITYGTLMVAIINFLIIGLVIFLLVKSITSMDGAAKKAGKRCKKALHLEEPPAPPAPPTTKECPFCITEISIKATKCPNCTSKLPEELPEESEDVL